MSCCKGNEWKLKLTEKCVKHRNYNYTHFCANQHCLQILCNECIRVHEDAHNKSKVIGLAKICQLAEVQAYFDNKHLQQVAYQKEKNNQHSIKNADPCQLICEIVDQHFYGSTQNKLEIAKSYNQSTTPGAKKLIEAVERSSEYHVP